MHATAAELEETAATGATTEDHPSQRGLRDIAIFYGRFVYNRFVFHNTSGSHHLSK